MSESKQKSNEILKQGTILASASIIVRIIGMLYQIPLNNILSGKAMGLYSIAFQIYSIALIISSYGLPLAVSKLVAAKKVKGEYNNVFKIFKSALLFALISGGIVSIIIYLNAETFAGMMKFPEAAMPLRVLAPTILTVALLGVIRGFFQGQNTMIPTAISQLFEQVINAIVSIVAAVWMLKICQNPAEKDAYGASGSTIGTFSGAVTALIIMVLIYIVNRPVFEKQKRRDRHPVEDTMVVYKMLLVTVLPVILSQLVYQVSGILDTTLFGTIMEGQGMPEAERTEMVGVYGRMYTLLLSVPLGIATAMGTSIIPSVVASFSSGDIATTKYKVKTVVKFNMLIAIPCAMGYTVLGEAISNTLFINKFALNHMAGKMLLFGAIALVFYALSTVTSGVLQALNQMRLPMIHSAISLGIHVVIVACLLKYTDLGIMALIVGNVTFPLVVCILNWRSVGHHLDYDQEVKTTFGVPFVASIIMGCVCVIVYQAIFRGMHLLGVRSFFVDNALATLLSICIGGVVYFAALLKLNGVSEEELLDMPLGRTMYTWAKKFHLFS